MPAPLLQLDPLPARASASSGVPSAATLLPPRPTSPPGRSFGDVLADSNAKSSPPPDREKTDTTSSTRSAQPAKAKGAGKRADKTTRSKRVGKGHEAADGAAETDLSDTETDATAKVAAPDADEANAAHAKAHANPGEDAEAPITDADPALAAAAAASTAHASPATKTESPAPADAAPAKPAVAKSTGPTDVQALDGKNNEPSAKAKSLDESEEGTTGDAETANAEASAEGTAAQPVELKPGRGGLGQQKGVRRFGANADEANPSPGAAGQSVAGSSADAQGLPTVAPDGDVTAGAASAVGSVDHKSAAPDLDRTSATPLPPDLSPGKTSTTSARAAAAPEPAAPPTEAQFAEANHMRIVSAIHADLLPNGGSMQLRLDPPELGALHVTVHLRDGVMTANFQASSDEAAKLLSHSLGDLKSMLETQGVSVEKLHVTHVPRQPDARGDSGGDDDARRRGRDDDGRSGDTDPREQQRRQMLQRMWDRLAGKAPLDTVA